MIDRIAAVIAAYLTQLRQTADDRGDGPVQTAIIIAGLAALAVIVVAWAVGRATDFMNSCGGGGK